MIMTPYVWSRPNIYTQRLNKFKIVVLDIFDFFGHFELSTFH